MTYHHLLVSAPLSPLFSLVSLCVSAQPESSSGSKYNPTTPSFFYKPAWSFSFSVCFLAISHISDTVHTRIPLKRPCHRPFFSSSELSSLTFIFISFLFIPMSLFQWDKILARCSLACSSWDPMRLGSYVMLYTLNPLWISIIYKYTYWYILLRNHPTTAMLTLLVWLFDFVLPIGDSSATLPM